MSRFLFCRAFHLAGVDGKIFRSGRSVGDGFLDLHVFLGTFTHGDHVASLHETAGREATDAVDGEVAVSDILTGSEDRTGKTHAEDEGVKTGFEEDHQVVTGRTFTTVGFFVSLGELSFRNVVGEAEALLFDQLLLVHGSGLLAVLTMLARCEVAAVKSLLGLLGDGNAQRTGDLAFRSTE